MSSQPVSIAPHSSTSIVSRKPNDHSPAFSDADTFAGSLSPAPSSVHSPGWPTANLYSSPASHSQQQLQNHYNRQQRFSSTSPPFDSDAALPATPASDYPLYQPIGQHQLQQASHQPSTYFQPLQQSTRKPIDSFMAPAMLHLGGGRVIDAVTTSPTSHLVSSPSVAAMDDMTRYVDWDLNAGDLSPHLAFPATSLAGADVNAADGDDGSTTWKAGQQPTSSMSSTTSTQPRTSVFDMFAANYPQSSSVVASASSPPMHIQSSSPNASSSFADSFHSSAASTAWSTNAPFAFGGPQMQSSFSGTMAAGLPASDPGVGVSHQSFGAAGTGSSVPSWYTSMGLGMAGGSGTTSMQGSQTFGDASISLAPAHQHQQTQQQHVPHHSHSHSLPINALPQYQVPQFDIQPQQQQQQQNTFHVPQSPQSLPTNNHLTSPQHHEFTFSPPLPVQNFSPHQLNQQPLASPGGPGSLDIFRFIGSYSSSSAATDYTGSLLGSNFGSFGSFGGELEQGIAPALIHQSPLLGQNGNDSEHDGALYSPVSYPIGGAGSSYEVPWDAGFMDGVDDAYDANALGLGLESYGASNSNNAGGGEVRGRRMRRPTVRANAMSPTSPTFMLDEDMESNASTRHDDDSSDELGMSDDEFRGRRGRGSDDEDDEDEDDEEYHEDDEYRPRQARRRRISHGGQHPALSFSPPSFSTSAPNNSSHLSGAVPFPSSHAANRNRSARRQGTIRGLPRGTTSAAAPSASITYHTANGITYASLPQSSTSTASSALGQFAQPQTSAAAGLAGMMGPPAGLPASYASSTSASGSGTPSSLTKRSRGRQVPTVRLVDVPPPIAPPMTQSLSSSSTGAASAQGVSLSSSSSSRSPIPVRTVREDGRPTHRRRRSRLASETTAVAGEESDEDENTGAEGEGLQVKDDDQQQQEQQQQIDDEGSEDDSEYDDRATAAGRSLRASTRNARNTRRKVKASASLATIHAGSANGAAGALQGGEETLVVVGGSSSASMGMNWSDGRTRSYVCRVNGCGKCFQRGEHLKRHIRSIHTNDKPFACPQPGCSKTFSRRDNLLQHTTIHNRYAAK